MSGASELARVGHVEEGASMASNIDDVPVVTAEVAVEEAPAIAKPTVGERLRAGREARGMDAEAVAAVLKLSRRQVEALEAGDWDKLPGHTFIRGFVRNYARAVQLDTEALIADLDAPVPQAPRLDLPQNATAVMPQTGQPQRRDYAAVLAGLVLVAIAVVAYYVVPSDLWLSKTEPAAEPAAKESAAPLFPPGATPSGVLPTADQVAPAPAPSNETQPAAAAAPVTPAVAAAAAAPDTAAASDGKGLHFAFAQPSWVEVRDKSGQIVFSQLNPAGSVREVGGTPPFALVVGNAAHVTVHYQGRAIDLQPRSKDDVARVTVE